jgi:hypothetical protein
VRHPSRSHARPFERGRSAATCLGVLLPGVGRCVRVHRAGRPRPLADPFVQRCTVDRGRSAGLVRRARRRHRLAAAGEPDRLDLPADRRSDPPAASGGALLQAECRQRLEASRPLGNSRNAKSANPAGKTSTEIQFKSHAAQSAPGSPPVIDLDAIGVELTRLGQCSGMSLEPSGPRLSEMRGLFFPCA